MAFFFSFLQNQAEGKGKAHLLLEIHEMFQKGGCYDSL